MKRFLSALTVLAILFFFSPASAGVNTHSTGLVAASSQLWNITDASQTGLGFTGAFTLCGWVKFASLPASNTEVGFITKWGSAAGASAYQLEFFNNAGTQTLQVNTLGNNGNHFSRVNWSPSVDTWYHVCASYNTSGSANVKFYVDGAQTGASQNDTNTSINTNASDFDIGAAGDAANRTNYLNGEVDDVQVYNAELSGATITSLYTASCDVLDSATNLQGRWRFDNNGDDSTSNNNDLTNVNTATFSTDLAYTCTSAAVPTPPQLIMFE
jgi:hypothetical protein